MFFLILKGFRSIESIIPKTAISSSKSKGKTSFSLYIDGDKLDDYKSIINQYDNMVTPMFEKYVRPMKKKSNIIIKKFGQSDVGYIKLIKKIQKIIDE